MTLGGSELQVFVTFLVILACAFVALLMDYLKGNNEQLRERHVDLLVRQEQYVNKAGIDTAVLARSLEQVLGEQTATLKEIVAESMNDLALRELEESRQGGLPESRNYVSSLQDLPVWEIPEPKREAPSTDVADSDKVKISLLADADVKPAEQPTPNEAQSLAKVVPIRAEEPAAQLPEEGTTAQEETSEPAPATHDFDRFLDDLVSEFEANPEAYPEHQEILDSLNDSPEAPVEPAPLESVGAVQLVPLAAALESISKEIPAGFHPASELEELLAAPAAFSGLVVSVGINEFGDLHKNLGKQNADQFLANVDSLMQELLRDKAFLSRRSEDEYVLIEPELNGAFAQRRLNDISERLWDFQLRNLGSFSVVFSWGAHEAHGESLREAVEAAHEKMHETQAARKSSSIEKLRRRLATA